MTEIEKYTKKETLNNKLELKERNHLSKTEELRWEGVWEGRKQKHSDGFITWEESKEEIVVEEEALPYSGNVEEIMELEILHWNCNRSLLQAVFHGWEGTM